MALCDNVFCSEPVQEFEYVILAGRKFCCIACAEDWHRQNEALAEAASPFHSHAKEQKPKPITAAGNRRRFADGSRY